MDAFFHGTIRSCKYRDSDETGKGRDKKKYFKRG
jgi:hypothetical protein